VSDYFEVARKTEGRISSDTDLKLSDILRYYSRDSKAALDLLYRRTRRLADFELENKNLEKARLKHKDEKTAEQSQQLAKQKFEQISELAKSGELRFDCFRFDSKENLILKLKCSIVE
jgi:sorting nexin-5/6/32